MFTNLWKKCVQWQSSRRRPAPRPTRAIPRVETLEDRITPANYNTFVNTTGLLTLTRTTAGANTLTIASTSTFGEYTVTTNGTIDGGLATWTNTVPVNEIVVYSGNGDDTINFAGSVNNGPLNLSGGLGITGTGGNKTISLNDVNVLSHAALDINLTGNGTENTTFTDVNATGATTINHPNAGNTAVTFNTTNLNPIATNTFNTLSITNGSGSDINMIKDSDFAGNVTINNGAGSGNNQYGGSENIFSAGNNTGLLSAQGNVTITTSSGQSDTEIYDYNVQGTLAITTGAGVGGQAIGNFVGIEDKQTNVAVPTIGAVTITGNAVSGLSPGLQVDLGISRVGQDYPLSIAGALTVTANGSGAANILLNDLNVHGTTTLNLGGGTFNDNVTIQGDNAIADFAAVTVHSSAIGVNTYDVQTVAGTTNITGALTFKLANATDTIDTGLGNTGILDTSGNLAITGGNGTKTLNILDANLGGLSTNLSGTGTENATFTDDNVLGTATVSHNSGATFFTINTSGSNVNAFNSWNTLTLTDGAGSDTNTVNDTNFSGNVTINNGAGSGSAQFGGSHTVFSDLNNPGLLTIKGNLVISTSSGQSDTEVYDYNIHGAVTISTGAGVGGQSTGSYVGLENNQTNSGSGTPVIGGAVTVTGTAVRNVNPGVTIDMGTNAAGTQFFPLIINGNLTVTANGSGSALVNLNDLIVAYGTTTINFASTTANNQLFMQGTSIDSIYWNLVINSSAGGNNSYSLQDSAGTLLLTGTVKATLGSGNDTVNLGADAGNPNGFNGAIVELFSFTSALFNGEGGVNFHWSAPGATLFDYQNPVWIDI